MWATAEGGRCGQTPQIGPSGQGWGGVGEAPPPAQVRRAGEQTAWDPERAKSGSKGHAISSVPAGRAASKNYHHPLASPLGYQEAWRGEWERRQAGAEMGEKERMPGGQEHAVGSGSWCRPPPSPSSFFLSFSVWP